MRSDLPKVLHSLHGKPMIQHVIDRLREAGITDLILVVGYGRDRVIEQVGDQARFAIQEPQLGTGHAVQQALPLLGEAGGPVIICYGDMPLLRAATLRALIEAQSQPGIAGALLTAVTATPPDFGRIVRAADGRVAKIIEVRDCTPEQLQIKEVNVGVYCFAAEALRWALPRLSNQNAQREFYLTDVVQILAEAGRRLETVRTENLEEAIGINDRRQLEFAERLADIAYAESLFPLIDAAIAMERQRHQPIGPPGSRTRQSTDCPRTAGD